MYIYIFTHTHIYNKIFFINDMSFKNDCSLYDSPALTYKDARALRTIFCRGGRLCVNIKVDVLAEVGDCGRRF